MTPAGSTIRRWAAEELWAARADADLVQTCARTLAEFRAGWLGALSLAQQTLMAGLVGELDDLPHAGAARLKSAELVLKTLQHARATIVPSESCDHAAGRRLDIDAGAAGAAHARDDGGAQCTEVTRRFSARGKRPGLRPRPQRLLSGLPA